MLAPFASHFNLSSESIDMAEYSSGEEYNLDENAHPGTYQRVPGIFLLLQAHPVHPNTKT